MVAAAAFLASPPARARKGTVQARRAMARTVNKILLAVAAAAGLAGSASAETPPPVQEQEARIPFFHLGHFRTFRAAGRDTLYIEARSREWYRVTTFGACTELPWARRIGVDTRGTRTFDRFSTLIVNGQRCGIASVVRAEGPPPRRERRRS